MNAFLSIFYRAFSQAPQATAPILDQVVCNYHNDYYGDQRCAH